MKKRIIALMAPCLVLSPIAMSAGISGPVSFPSAKVLPKNVRNFQYNGIFAQGTNKYNNNGTSESLGSSFDSNITYQDLVNNEETLQDQLFAEGKILNAPNVDLSDSMGRTNGEVNLAVNVHAPVFAYGINKKWTMAMVIPVIQSDLNIDVGSVSSESLQNVADYFAEPGQAMLSKLQTVQEKFNNAVARKIKEKGYDQLEDRKKTELGDIQVISKYNFYDQNSTRVTLSNSLTLPTGKRADIDKLIDIGSGDEQFDIGTGITIDKDFDDKLTLSASANIIIQIEHQTKERIYEKDDSSITSQIDSNTKRDLGDIFQAAVGGKYRLSQTLTIQTAYSYQIKGEDKFSGNKYDYSNYNYLSKDTEQEMQAIQLGLTFDTLALYRKKEFMAPMEMGLGYTKPIVGRNVLTDGLVTANLSLYF